MLMYDVLCEPYTKPHRAKSWSLTGWSGQAQGRDACYYDMIDKISVRSRVPGM